MANNLYNPLFKTKQIYSLTVTPTGTPGANEMYHWMTYENGKIYANYRINGVNEDKKYEITDPVSFNPNMSFTNKVKSIIYDSENQVLTYSDEERNYDILLDNFLTAYEITIDEQTNIMTFSTSNHGTYTVNMPDVYKKHIVSGLYNSTSRNLVLTYNDNTTISIDVTALAKTYTGTSTSTIVTNVSSDIVSSDLRISMQEGNQIQIKSDGLYVPAFEDADLDDFVMRSELDDYVLKESGKVLSTEDFTTAMKNKLNGINLDNYVLKESGKGLSTEDFTTSLKNKLDGLSSISISQGTGMDISLSNGVYTIGLDTTGATDGQVLTKTENGVEWKDIPSNEENAGGNYKNGAKIEFTNRDSANVVWNGNVATFIHGLNCYPIVAVYDNTMTQALYGVKILNENMVQIDFTNKQEINGVWKMIASYGYPVDNSISWLGVREAIINGDGPTAYPVGTKLIVPHAEYTTQSGVQGIEFTVLGYDQVPTVDNSIQHTMCLGAILFYGPYDEIELEYALTADTTAISGKTYYTYDGSAYTALTEGTDYNAGDSIPENTYYEKNFSYRCSAVGGSNNFAESNLLQWANSNGAAGEWFTPQTIFDNCSTNLGNRNGFLKYLDQNFLSIVKEARLTTEKCNDEGGGTYTTDAKFWPLSKTQINGSANYSNMENERLTYFSTYRAEATANNYWLRSPSATCSSYVYSMCIGWGGDMYFQRTDIPLSSCNSNYIYLACIIG